MYTQTQATEVLLGVLYGDCLGAPYEFSFQPLQHEVKVGTSVFGHAPGRGTDDTETTIAVATGLTAQPYDGSSAPVFSIADRLLDWYDSRPLDIGGTTALGLRNYRETQNPVTGCDDVGSQANGSLMRSAPFAFHPMGIELAVISSRTTHAHPMCLASVRMYVEMLKMLLNGKKYPKTLKSDDPEKIPGGGGYVWYALQLAIWAATEAKSFESGIEAIVRLGGDTDTNGAICGAVLAARFGFPDHLLVELDPGRVSEMFDLGDGLAQL